ncbi:glycosyltransferase [Micromonospora sp. NBC_01655]|uniref:glycosyltransferase family 2 protein n=1 Tax=Micromonospora sp. NBC_01655 TaxID=2975983 RepID=UPI0022558B8A|nr:glycosyltransferase family 2 protein [Micromonospora sp. NBC_01655]MCX4473207.1 glycosyltransferase [Micromonospora sp. NBC_01655]
MVSAAPLVSVIVPNYNYARTLRLCLAALAGQTHHPLEVIVVDDGSTDDSVAVARSFPEVRLLHTPVNSGPSVARNIGADAATGEILVFVDSDVALAPDAVATAVAILRDEPGVGAVCGNYDTVPLIRGSFTKDYRNLFRHWYFRIAEGSITGFLSTAILALPVRVWAEVGPWNPRLTQSEGADVAERLTDRYEVRMTSSVIGRHDDDATLGIALSKVFTRTRVHIPFFLNRRRVVGVVTSTESGTGLASWLAAATAPLPLLAGPAWAAVPVLLLALWLLRDTRMYRYVRAVRGLPYTVRFAALHLLVSLTIGVGVAAGLAQWLVSARFRRLYESPAVAA